MKSIVVSLTIIGVYLGPCAPSWAGTQGIGFGAEEAVSRVAEIGTAGWLTALSASDHLFPSQVDMIAVPMILPVVAMSIAISRQIDRRKRFAAAPK
jgi:hypothetical protein